MEGSVIDLSKYRLAQAQEALSDSQKLFDAGSYKASVNRSYYAIFHSLRAVTALDEFDSSKHSGVIAFFNKEYVKTGIFDKHISKILDLSFRLREKADYEDFYIVSKDSALEQLKRADQLVAEINKYLVQRWK
ncbi:MAG: HEPN domain-containing protein [Pseudobutyrivibrio sp.]|nr:HEPN domain-containing protein [Pseudobutyrivibrio sp.]